MVDIPSWYDYIVKEIKLCHTPWPDQVAALDRTIDLLPRQHHHAMGYKPVSEAVGLSWICKRFFSTSTQYRSNKNNRKLMIFGEKAHIPLQDLHHVILWVPSHGKIGLLCIGLSHGLLLQVDEAVLPGRDERCSWLELALARGSYWKRCLAENMGLVEVATFKFTCHGEVIPAFPLFM